MPSLGGTAARDQQWWDSLVECNSQQVWNIARGQGLDVNEAGEVFGLVWLRLADHLGDIATDDHVRQWVCAAADREARVVVARQRATATAAGRPGASLGRLGA